MFGAGVFGVHLDAELLVDQHHEGDGARVGLHVEQEGVLHHQPAAQTQTSLTSTESQPLGEKSDAAH